MPTFDFTGPDGKNYEVEGPEGATPAQAFQILQGHLGKQNQADNQPSFASGMVRSAARGVPIVGGLLNKADAATDAALAPIMNPLFPEKEQLKGDFGQRYKQALGVQEGEDAAFGKANPYASTAAEIGGGIAGLGGAAMTGLGAKALGLTAKTLPGMMAQGAASGAAIGGLDTGVRGGDVTEGAALGGAAGAAGPLIGAGIGALAKPFVRFGGAMAKPEIEAASQVRNALEADAGKGLTPQEWQGAESRGMPVTLMDQGAKATQRLARRASNYSPEAQEALTATTQGRFLTQAPRTAEWLSEISNYPDADATKKALDQARKSAQGVLYGKAMAKGASGVWNDNLEGIVNHPWIKKAIPDALDQSNAEAVLEGKPPIKNPFTTDADGILRIKSGVKPTLEFWDALKKNIDGRVEGSTATATSRGDPNTVRMGTNLLHALTREVDGIVPEYATARATSAKFFGASDALKAGMQTATPATVASRVDNRTLRDTLKKYSSVERKLFEQGFMDKVITDLLGKPDTFNVLRAIGQSPKARERVMMVLGPDRYAGLEATLRVEGMMDRFRTAIGGNSTTAQQFGDMSSGSVVPNFRMSVSRLIEDALVAGAKKIGAGVDERVATKIAAMLTGDGSEYAKALRMITKNKGLMNALRASDVGAIVTRGAVSGMGSQ